MGATFWSDAYYRNRAAHRAALGRSAFEFDQDIRERFDLGPSNLQEGPHQQHLRFNG